MAIKDTFNPMEESPLDNQALLWANQQSQVRSVLDSYHGKLDGLIEALQNSVDAIEARWKASLLKDADSTELDGIPRIQIELNFEENSISILDNGIGIHPEKLPTLLRPFLSDKRISGASYRGHKGVGTTLLAYGHLKFEIHTKHEAYGEAVGYILEGGRDWAFSATPSEPPSFRRLSSLHTSMASLKSGTFTKLYLDAQSADHRLKSILHNTPEMWATVLRACSALGYVDISSTQGERADWAKSLFCKLTHPSGIERVPFSFPLPHEVAAEADEAKELQWLQNHPGNRREYSLIFLSKTHSQLRDFLKSEIDELENSEELDDLSILEAFRKYEIAAYASLSYKNTFYDEQFRSLIQKPNAKRLSLPYSINGGVLLSSVNMPMADLQDHLWATIPPQTRRRYFLLLHLNDKFSPDIGRKTIPQEVEPVAAWLERVLLKLLRTQESRLLRDRSRDTRPTGGSLGRAAEELKEVVARTQVAEDADDELDMSDLVIQRTPTHEEEIVALFVNLLSKRVIKGYTVRALPGNASRYDCLFDYAADSVISSTNEKFGIHADTLGPTGIRFTERWLEFKKDVDSLVQDLEAEDGYEGKKYFSQLDVSVVWEANDPTSENYELKKLETRDRQFFAATHVLFAENNDHRIEIIELRSIISQWKSSRI